MLINWDETQKLGIAIKWPSVPVRTQTALGCNYATTRYALIYHRLNTAFCRASGETDNEHFPVWHDSIWLNFWAKIQKI